MPPNHCKPKRPRLHIIVKEVISAGRSSHFSLIDLQGFYFRAGENHVEVCRMFW